MAITLPGAGTRANPWLISEVNHLFYFSDAASGYFKLTKNIISGQPAGSFYTNFDRARTSAPGAKVLDGAGYVIDLNVMFVGTGERCVFRNLCLKNVTIKIRVNCNSLSGLLFSYCSLIDVAVYMDVSGALTFGLFGDTSGAQLETPRYFNRVVVAAYNPAGALAPWYSGNESFSGVGIGWAFAYVSTTPPITRITTYSLENIDNLTTVNSMILTGWGVEAGLVRPGVVDNVSLNVISRVAGLPKSRLIWMEYRGRYFYLGKTSEAGEGAFIARPPKGASFSVIASEEVGADVAAKSRITAANQIWNSPIESDYAYQADKDGTFGDLSGVVWGDSSITTNGVVLAPRLIMATVNSKRYLASIDGVSLTIELDTHSGQSGPTGDPAYLDGVVEEIHPMLGTVRALANAEVLAFERRGVEFVAMGRAYSNAIGEFRVETEVYGGGDIFAFAADFPGVIWQAGVVLNLGDRVRPSLNNGYVYEVITAGNSGSTEPAWWADAGDGSEGAIGSATAKARPYYQPVGHGPLKMILVE